MDMAKKSVTNDPRCNPQARGRRLRSLRKMTDLSRKMMAEKYNLSAGTLQGWEDGRYGGLTEKGSRKVLNALRSEGIQCSFDWLMYGVGMGPQISDILYMDEQQKTNNQEDKVSHPDKVEQDIRDEILLFRQHTSDAIDVIIGDDAMLPFYNFGDIVGGKRRFEDDIATLIGQDCIIQTTLGETLVRRLRAGTTGQRFTLTSINPETNVIKPTLYDIELLSAAPISWIRRKDSVSNDANIVPKRTFSIPQNTRKQPEMAALSEAQGGN